MIKAKFIRTIDQTGNIMMIDRTDDPVIVVILTNILDIAR